jgi:3D-(3,5/4)-trihydroxycyclohexane-1,2-dione acylhydrolase (decyclizing)
MSTVRLTVAQALMRFLAVQYTERDGDEQRTIAGTFGIFGHGNLAGVGQALLQSELDDPSTMPYVLARNEQGMVHAAVGYARMTDRLSTWACTASIGPGSTNMLTGAALATINRLPVLLLPSDVFATRTPDPVLQQLEYPLGPDVTVNDAFRPVSRFFDRIARPEQLPAALLGAMRVLTDPAETGAVTVCLPQDVQTEAYDWPLELFERRVWHVTRPAPDPAVLARAATLVRGSSQPLIVAGGGMRYARAGEVLRQLVDASGIPVGETQAGKGSLPYDHPLSLGAIGSTGTTAANEIAAEADLVIGVGTRYSDFTTASKSAFRRPDVRFVNINVAAIDASKHAGVMVLADARTALEQLRRHLEGWQVEPAYRQRADDLRRRWDEIVTAAYRLGHEPLPAQSEVIGVVNDVAGPRDVVVCAAGSMPGDLHKLWRTRDSKSYHVEYGYSCMGYEIAGALGARLACPDRDVFAMVGDGSYLMLAQELVTAVQERIKIIVVLVQNHGFASIGALSDHLGSQRYGTQYRYRDASGRLQGERLPVDLAANAESLGARVLRATGIASFRAALEAATRHDGGPVVVHVETDPLVPAPRSGSWWDVPVAEVSDVDTTQRARHTYVENKQTQRAYLRQ